MVSPSVTSCTWREPLSHLAQCQFVSNHSSVCAGGGYVPYALWYFCAAVQNPIPVSLLLLMFLIALSVAADAFFCPAIAVIVDHLKISQNIAIIRACRSRLSSLERQAQFICKLACVYTQLGVSFLAFGNGAPDIFSSLASVVSTETPKPDMALGALFGAGVFLTTFVAGTITFIGPFAVMRRPLLRDLTFFIGALLLAVVMLLNGRVTLAFALGFLILYAIYAAVVVIGRYVRVASMQRRRDETLPDDSDAGQIDPGQVGPLQIAAESGQQIVQRRRPLIRDMSFSSIAEEANWSFPTNHLAEAHHHTEQPDPMMPDPDDFVTDDDSVFFAGETGRARSIGGELKMALRPFSAGCWRDSTLAARAMLVLKAPTVCLLKLTVPVVDFDMHEHNWSKPLAVLHCVTCPLFALFAVKGITKMTPGTVRVPLAVPVLFLALPVLVSVAVFTERRRKPRFHKYLAYVGFTVSVLWIYLLAREVVGLVTLLGALTGASNELLGLTLLAWSNSLGDIITDVSVARQGLPRMAISACFGGPLFNLLVGAGLTFTIACVRHPSGALPIEFTSVLFLLVFSLGWSLLTSLIILPLSNFEATRIYAGYLFAIYVVFLAMVVFTETGAITLW